MTKKRCSWCGTDPLYIAYHDQEWGVPVYDDQTLFEFLVLETFQAGLSWITILKKRENFRKAFDGFHYTIISKYNQKKINELLLDTGIIRNKLKVHATVSNAIAFQKVKAEFGSFSKYIWRFLSYNSLQNNSKSTSNIPANTFLSDTISKDLKRRGFKFVGTTVVYAYMQAIGMVNDHADDCFRHSNLKPSSHLSQPDNGFL